MDKRMRKRILMTVLGIFAGGVSVGFFKTAAFGVDPFQTLMSGLDKLIPIHFGTLYVLTNAVLLLFAFFADRHYISLGTFINLFLLGYVVEFSHNLLLRFFPEPALPLRLLFMLIAILMLCISSSFYFTADLGVSTYDAIALVLANKWHVAPFKYCRIATDLACVLLGCTLYLLAGGKLSMLPTIAGFGTIITAFFMGPLIDYFNIHLAKPFLEKK